MPLRPVYFRVCHADHVHAGYYRLGELTTVGFKVYAPVIDARRIASDCMRSDPDAARRVLKMLPDERDMIALPAGLAEPALMPGAIVRFTKGVDLWPHTYVEEGERGVVARRDRITGEVSIFMEHHHPGLADTGNTVWAIPHLGDEPILSALALEKQGHLYLLGKPDEPFRPADELPEPVKVLKQPEG